MTTEAQTLANQRNARLSCGPRTAQGRLVSSQNARKHGLRAACDSILRDVGIAYEERKQKWVRDLDPRTDREEFLAHQQVITSFSLEQVHAAHIEQVTSDIEGAEDRLEAGVRQLAKRLYFNRAGLAASYGLANFRRDEPHTSSSGTAVDQDDPAELVRQLESSAPGCQWLVSEWTALRERLEGQSFWQSIDRFQAIRLLGRQPIDAGRDQTIAEIFVASHGIEPVRKKPGSNPVPEPVGALAFQDLKSDFSPEELRNFADGVTARWPDMVRASDRDRCREILVNLVEENIARLTVQREVHEDDVGKLAQKTVTQLGFDRSYDGELMRRYELRYKAALDRTVATYDRVRRKDSGDKEPGNGRNVERRVPIFDDESRGRTVGTASQTGLAATTVGASDSGGCGPDDDIEWARQIDPSDLLVCGGYLPERFIQDGGHRKKDGGRRAEGGGKAMREEGGSDVAGEEPLGVVRLACDEGAGTAGTAEELPCSELGEIAGMGSERLGGLAEASHSQEHEDGGLDKLVTNEPILAEVGIRTQPSSDLAVTVDSGDALGLDRATNEPISGVEPETGRGIVSRDSEGSLGGHLAMNHAARAPSRRDKKKMKRDVRLERKALARREMERRVCTRTERPGSTAEARGMRSGDLREVVPRAP